MIAKLLVHLWLHLWRGVAAGFMKSSIITLSLIGKLMTLEKCVGYSFDPDRATRGIYPIDKSTERIQTRLYRHSIKLGMRFLMGVEPAHVL